MSEQKSPAGGSGDVYNIQAESVGAVGPGSYGQVIKYDYRGGEPLDREAFKASLMELFQSLGSAHLPGMAGIKAQTAVGRALEVAEQQAVQPSVVAEQLQQIGATLKQANATIQQGSQLAVSLQKIAKIAAPFLNVGAHVVAGWLGIPLP